jgi:predicted CXXCH cytochrome family protein
VKKRYLLAGLAFFFAAGLAYTVLRGGPHDFEESQCPECHAQAPVKGRHETLRMTAPIKRLCTRCHVALENYTSHPVEISPKRVSLPEDLPLAWNGKMTCSTCHDIHATPSDRLAGKFLYLRRVAGGPAFCAACHDRLGKGKEEEIPHVMMNTVHMRFEQEGSGDLLDPLSRQCLSCHDGSIGRDASVRVGRWKHDFPLVGADPRGTHPVGVSYLRARRRDMRALKPLSQLNSAVKLINGTVGCTSCHNPYSRAPGQLVMSNEGSRLCLSCHDK